MTTLRARFLLAFLACSAPSSGLNITTGEASLTYLNTDGKYGRAWFICDGLDVPSITVGGVPNAQNRARFTVYSKASPGSYAYSFYDVGGGDPGAGSIHYPLTRRGGKVSTTDNLTLANLGGPKTPDRTFTPPFVSLTVGGERTDCRWLRGTRLMGFSKGRSFLVTQAPNGALTYQTFDFGDARTARPTMPDGVQRSSTPSLTVRGGRVQTGADAETFTFQNDGYSYAVRVARLGKTPGPA